MSLRVGVVSDRTVAPGFRLAGLEPRAVTSASEAALVLREMMDDDRFGVVLVQEDLVPEGAPPSTRKDRPGLPLVVLFPPPRVARPEDEALAYVTELLRSAVGYRVRLR
jgi:vacuolar-type H+-ATPase subunit F/Vma7